MGFASDSPGAEASIESAPLRMIAFPPNEHLGRDLMRSRKEAGLQGVVFDAGCRVLARGGVSSDSACMKKPARGGLFLQGCYRLSERMAVH